MRKALRAPAPRHRSSGKKVHALLSPAAEMLRNTGTAGRCSSSASVTMHKETPMIATASSLLEHPEAGLPSETAPRISVGIELALFRARGALLDGWHLTPEEALAYTAGLRDGSPVQPGDYLCHGQEEDEACEVALYFGD